MWVQWVIHRITRERWQDSGMRKIPKYSTRSHPHPVLLGTVSLEKEILILSNIKRFHCIDFTKHMVYLFLSNLNVHESYDIS